MRGASECRVLALGPGPGTSRCRGGKCDIDKQTHIRQIKYRASTLSCCYELQGNGEAVSPATQHGPQFAGLAGLCRNVSTRPCLAPPAGLTCGVDPAVQRTVMPPSQHVEQLVTLLEGVVLNQKPSVWEEALDQLFQVVVPPQCMLQSQREVFTEGPAGMERGKALVTTLCGT